MGVADRGPHHPRCLRPRSSLRPEEALPVGWAGHPRAPRTPSDLPSPGVEGVFQPGLQVTRRSVRWGQRVTDPNSSCDIRALGPPLCTAWAPAQMGGEAFCTPTSTRFPPGEKPGAPPSPRPHEEGRRWTDSSGLADGISSLGLKCPPSTH